MQLPCNFPVFVWFSDTVVGRWTWLQPLRFCMQPWESCLHTRASVTKQYNLVPAQVGKVIAGLASHWPCITGNSGITTYGLID